MKQKKTNFRSSIWLASRLLTIILLAASYIAFSFALIFDLSWQIGWSLIAFALAFEILQGAHCLSRGYYIFDSILFSLGVLVFLVSDVVLAIFLNDSFPAIIGQEYRGNAIGNLAGLVVVIFCLSFFAGRFFFSKKIRLMHRESNVSKNLAIVSPLWLWLATFFSIISFFANGTQLSISNLLATITARANGYVAFASSGLGNENPIIVLLAASIPTTIILWLSTIRRGRYLANCLAAFISIGLFILFILTGGRSGAILVILTLVIFKIIQNNYKVRIGRVLIFAFVTLAVLTVQSNYRDSGRISFSNLEHSPFRGFSLNREVAFIVSRYGEEEDFISRGIYRFVLPIPETVFLFVTNPIPRVIWKSKPIDPSFGPYNLARTGATGFGATSNVTPTIPGRYYILYGIPGVIQIGLVFGLLWGWANQKIVTQGLNTPRTALLFSMFTSIMFISFRDLTPGKFYPFLWLLLILYVSRIKASAKSPGHL